MRLKSLELSGFKSFAKKTALQFDAPVSAIVGPNGSGKSNVAEGLRFVLGEQSMKSMRGKRGEDLIWNGSEKAPRANHASVTITFDNAERAFGLDFHEVAIRREVHRDGTNHYFINNSKVRLKDIFEILAKVHIGATGHHIISQGEADRILNASIKERRVMIEETLGLTLYQWKIEESEKKLGKTEENMREVEILRKELAPHLKFLRKQVEKIEEGKKMRDALGDMYVEYLSREQAFIKDERVRIEKEQQPLRESVTQAEKNIEILRAHLKEASGRSKIHDELDAVDNDLRSARTEKDALSRDMGRIEGQIMAEERRITRARTELEREKFVPLVRVRHFVTDLIVRIDDLVELEDLSRIRALAKAFRESAESFVDDVAGAPVEIDEAELARLRTEKELSEKKLAALALQEQGLTQTLASLRSKIEQEKSASYDKERELFSLMQEKGNIEHALRLLDTSRERVQALEDAYKAEIAEGIILVGKNILRFEENKGDLSPEPRTAQEDRKKQIERYKLKLEDQGIGGGDDIVKEHQETEERDQFLARELVDLEQASKSLHTLIDELAEKLDREFKDGIKKINHEFQNFFTILFGGGSASLDVVKEQKRRRTVVDPETGEEVLSDAPEEEIEEGIEIAVTLPRKKVKGLTMLSGGERALTSIALIFAVSQVNPPPFLVLDETDAALDESNSRKYGDMLASLSSRSQLIVITHNRETMRRADVLYGVTMDQSAVSKLLSVRFDDAVQYAK